MPQLSQYGTEGLEGFQRATDYIKRPRKLDSRVGGGWGGRDSGGNSSDDRVGALTARGEQAEAWSPPCGREASFLG